MTIDWGHVGPTVAAAFLASMVEFVEALTVVLAVGTTRGWRGALAGTGAALAVLFFLCLMLGSALTRIPLDLVQIIVGTLLLLFGMRWLRKAILRSAGIIPLHDEVLAFAKHTEAMRAAGGMMGGWDKIGMSAAFEITMLEGIEVVFIVIAVGAGGPDMLMSAACGALGALAIVLILGLALHRPLAAIPENTFKFIVGILLSAFGTFWVGEGLGFDWPGNDLSILGLIAGFLIVAVLTTRTCRSHHSAA